MTQDLDNISSPIYKSLSIPAIIVVFLISIFTICYAANASVLSDALMRKIEPINTQETHENKQINTPERHTALSTSLYNNRIYYGNIGFDLNQHKIIKQLPGIASLHLSKTEADSFSIKNWSKQYVPLLNGIPVKVIGKSLTICIDALEDSFFIATEQELSRINRNGKIIWKHVTDEIVTEALISPDQQTLILRFDNNVISWYSFNKGTRLFSLFIKPETQQWILWSPQGYYDASEPDFSPVSIQLNKTININLSQLRYFAFKPSVIQQMIKNEFLPAGKELPDIILPDNIRPPVILPQEDDITNKDSFSFCIQSLNHHPVTISFAVNGVITQRKTTSHAEISKSSDCSYEISYDITQLTENHDLTVLAYDLTDNIWSEKYQHTRSTRAMKAVNQANTKVIYNDKSQIKGSRNQTIFKSYFKAGSVVSFGTTINNNKMNTSVYSALDNPFVLYLSAACEVTENDIYFKPIKSSKSYLTISQLTARLQATKVTSSVILLDCQGNGIAANHTKLKRILHHFQFASGRNFIFQLSQAQPAKQSNMMKALGIAAAGEADFNDDLKIDSNELMKFMIKSLPEVSFSEIGETGFIFSHFNKRNVFEIPVLLDD